MSIRLGYACINTQLPSSNRTTRLANATHERIIELARLNLAALDAVLRWNVEHRIAMFRISSEVIPLASHPQVRVDWEQTLQPELAAVGEIIRQNGLRVSMHPGQYTVLNSPRPEVVEASVAELEYHTRFLDSLGVGPEHKIVLHLGGVYGDKPSAMGRFVENFARLSSSTRRRLVLENDEKNYTLAEAISVAEQITVPVVFDSFHHGWNPSFHGEPLRDLIDRAAATWKPEDGRLKVHYSDPWPGKPPGSHSQSVDVDAFGVYYQQVEKLEIDVMLEVKDKEQSVLALYRRFPELTAS